MHGQTVSKTLVPLLAICCLVPFVALALVLYLGAPVWLVVPSGLLALVLLARRLMRLMASDHAASPSGDIPERRGLR